MKLEKAILYTVMPSEATVYLDMSVRKRYNLPEEIDDELVSLFETYTEDLVISALQFVAERVSARISQLETFYLEKGIVESNKAKQKARQVLRALKAARLVESHIFKEGPKAVNTIEFYAISSYGLEAVVRTQNKKDFHGFINKIDYWKRPRRQLNGSRSIEYHLRMQTRNEFIRCVCQYPRYSKSIDSLRVDVGDRQNKDHAFLESDFAFSMSMNGNNGSDEMTFISKIIMADDDLFAFKKALQVFGRMSNKFKEAKDLNGLSSKHVSLVLATPNFDVAEALANFLIENKISIPVYFVNMQIAVEHDLFESLYYLNSSNNYELERVPVK